MLPSNEQTHNSVYFVGQLGTISPYYSKESRWIRTVFHYMSSFLTIITLKISFTLSLIFLWSDSFVNGQFIYLFVFDSTFRNIWCNYEVVDVDFTFSFLSFLSRETPSCCSDLYKRFHKTDICCSISKIAVSDIFK